MAKGLEYIHLLNHHDVSSWRQTRHDTDQESKDILWPKQIAICSVGELFGGVERHILGLLQGLQARGVEILLALFHNGELATQVREQGIEPVILPNSNLSLLNTSRQFAQLLKQRQIEVVHVHGYKATVFCALARYWYRYAIVKTEHGLPEMTASKPISALRGRLYHLLDIAAARISKATVCYVTEELLGHHRQSHSGLRLITIPNGIASMDRNRYRRPPEFCQDWYNLVIVGRLEPVKGHYLAIKAVATEVLSKNLHLHFIGTGLYESELRTMARTHGITERVHFLGFRRNIYDYIAYCDILLMPSLHEGLPYTLLEAMALETPIIATCVGGISEVLQNEVSALLIPPRDAKALIQAITRLHDDPNLCYRLTKNALQLQQTRYSLVAMTESYCAIYRKARLVTDLSPISKCTPKF